MSVIESLSVIGAGVFIAVLGVLIKYFGYMHLIAGYDSAKVTDEQALADFVGTRVLLVALLTIAVGLAAYVSPSNGTPWYWYVYGALVVILTGWLILGARRYES